MKIESIYQQHFSFTILATLVFMVQGCLGPDKIASEIRTSRQSRYKAMTRIPKEGEKSDWKILSGPLSLEEGMSLALMYNKDVQKAKLRLIEAKGQMTEAISTALPTANFTGTGNRNDNDSIFAGQKETYELNLLVKQPLYLGGLIGAALDAAQVFAYQTQQELRQAIQAVRLQVRESYWAAILARELVDVSLKAQIDAKKLLTDTQKKLQHGTVTRFEVLRAEVRLSAVEAELIRRQNEARLALTRLLDVLGVAQSSQVELTDKLNYNAVEIAEGQCLPTAMERRPDLLIGEAMVRLIKDNVAAEQAGNRPKVYLQGMYMRGYPGAAAGFSVFDDMDQGGGLPSLDSKKRWDRTMYGGVLVEWPFFDGFATQGRVVRAKAQLRQQQVALRKLEQRAQLEITQALLNLESSEKFLRSQSGNVENAQESLRLARVGFQAGTVTSLDVISSELALAQGRSDYHRAVYDYKLAKLKLSAALGTIGEEQIPVRSVNQ